MGRTYHKYCTPARDELAIKYFTGIVPQENNLDQELSVEQNLQIYCRFYGMERRQARERIESLLDFMQLGEKRRANIRSLSGGMKRRLVIARALLNKPKLLILDEPTTGLDPQVRHLIWERLHALKEQGVTILLTTHYMEEAFQICDRLIMMHKGKKVLEGTPIQLVREHIEKYVLEVRGAHDLPRVEGLDCIRQEASESMRFLYSNEMGCLERVSEKLEDGRFFLRQANLEDVFLKVTGRHLEGDA